MPIIRTSYARDIGRCMGPVYFPDEVYNFYLNYPITDPRFADFRLDLYSEDEQSVVATNIGAMTQHMLEDGVHYHLLATFTIPAGTIFGMYRLLVALASDDTEVVRSNRILVEEPEVVENTAVLHWRNNTNLYGFDYENLPNWWNKVRYPIIQVGFKIEKEARQYRNITNDVLRNLRSMAHEVFTIEAYYFSEEAHKAIAAIFDHKDIYLNYTKIVPKTGYTVQENIRSVLSKGSVEVESYPEFEIPGALLDFPDENLEEQ